VGIIIFGKPIKCKIGGRKKASKSNAFVEKPRGPGKAGGVLDLNTTGVRSKNGKRNYD